MSTVTAPASASDAMDLVRAGLAYLAAVDATAMTAEDQARYLRGLEQVTSVTTAARTRILAGFGAGQGYCADGAYSPRAWLIHHTGITRGAAAGHTAWVRRAAAHPQVAAALAAEEISESFARAICGWTDQLPEDCRPAADEILLAAALSGLGLPDLAELAGEICARAPTPPTAMTATTVVTARAGRTRRSRTARSGWRPPSKAPGYCTVISPRSAPSWSGRCWTRCPPRLTLRTPGRRRSGTTMACRRRCAGW